MTYEEFIAAGSHANVLRILRISVDWTIKEAAKELGISASYISEVEKGKKIPSKKILDVYAEKIGLPEDWIDLLIIKQRKQQYTYQKLLLTILNQLKYS